MAETEAIFRIPSRTVQYGYVEIPVSADMTAEMMAAHYVNYVYAFQKEEEATVKRLKEGEAEPGDSRAAAKRLTEGRKPRTVTEANEMAKQVIEKELGPTTEVGDVVTVGGTEFTKVGENPFEGNAPWDKPAVSQKFTPKPKPWETESLPPEAVVTAPAVLDAVW